MASHKPEKLIIPEFKQFGGKHCVTTALKNLFNYHNLELSEEMLFGLGGGVGFIYWYMKCMPAPFIGCRYGKDIQPIIDTCKRVGAETTVFQTASATKGYEELKKLLRENQPVCVFVDMAYLPYMALPKEAHFGGHTIVIYGLDEKDNKVYVSDRGKKSVICTIDDLNKARNSKYLPFPPKNKLLKIKFPDKVEDLKRGIKESISECCTNMLKPPIENIGLKGIKKWADNVLKWPEQFKENLLVCLFNTFIYIEIGGTGGSAFRPMYAQFLKEASSVLNKPALNEAAEMFEDSAKAWSEVAASALPDSWPTLARIRTLLFQKNQIFEEQKANALKKMKKINLKIDYLTKEAMEELSKKDVMPLLSNLQQKILECYEIEKRAFEKLSF